MGPLNDIFIERVSSLPAKPVILLIANRADDWNLVRESVPLINDYSEIIHFFDFLLTFYTKKIWSTTKLVPRRTKVQISLPSAINSPGFVCIFKLLSEIPEF